MRRHYRIVTDDYNGFEVQRKRMGIWLQVNVNTHRTIEAAEAFIEARIRPAPARFKSEVVKEITYP